MELFVTKKGSELKSNHWIEGQKIKCSDSLGAYFIENGIATLNVVEEQKEEVEKPKVKRVKKED